MDSAALCEVEEDTEAAYARGPVASPWSWLVKVKGLFRLGEGWLRLVKGWLRIG